MHHIYYDNIRCTTVHIFHYYSSNSITSNHTVFTGVITSVCCLVSGHVSHRRRRDSYNMLVCGVLCALSHKFSQFSLSKRYYIVQYRRKKYVLVPLRLPAALLPFCAVVVDIYLLQHVFKVFQSTFSDVTVQFRYVTTELCNFDAKQSNLCCFDGFRTLYCCVDADVSFCDYYHSNLSRLFSKASVTVILLRCG